MKKYLILCFLFFSLQAISQIPQTINYQAILRTPSGQSLSNEQIDLKILILQGSTSGLSVCEEFYQLTTNAHGLINIQIGSQNPTDFSTIAWANGPYFIKTIVNEVEFGTTQLVSVPYALYAVKAGNVFDKNYESLTNKPDLSFFLNSSSTEEWDKNQADDFTGDYNSLSNLPNWGDSIKLKQPDLSPYLRNSRTSGWDKNQADDFDGNYNSLTNLPDWSDSIASKQPDLSPYLETNATDGWDKDALDDFNGDYFSLANAPNHVDTITAVLDTTTAFIRIEQDDDPANELQTLSRAGQVISLSHEGGSVRDSILTEETVDLFVANNGFATKNMENERITNLAEPTNAQDATTKNYVDVVNSRVNTLLKLLQQSGTTTEQLLHAGFSPQDLLTNEIANVSDLIEAGKTREELYGLEYAGGLIAYIEPSNNKGLIAAPYGVGRTEWDAEGSMHFGDPMRITTTKQEYKEGATNTIILLDLMTAERALSALACDTFNVNGYDDWHLPSYQEMYYVIENLYFQGVGNFTIETDMIRSLYWTSSILGGSLFTIVITPLDLNEGPYQSERTIPNYTRPVRYFDESE